MNIWEHLKAWIHRKEAEKFTVDSNNKTAVRIVGEVDAELSGEFVAKGLIGGKVAEININDSGWTLLTTGLVPNRRALTIQNDSGVNIKYNYDNTEPNYIGITIRNGDERYFDNEAPANVYAKAITGAGTVKVTIEEAY